LFLAALLLEFVDALIAIVLLCDGRVVDADDVRKVGLPVDVFSTGELLNLEEVAVIVLCSQEI
jgi:hypothetical protein